MLTKFYYYLVTTVEALFSVFGMRWFYEQPCYVLAERLGDEVEIRSYEPRLAVETTVESTDIRAAENEAFRLLLAYIAGANRGHAHISNDGTSETVVATVVDRDDGSGRDYA